MIHYFVQTAIVQPSKCKMFIRKTKDVLEYVLDTFFIEF